MASRPTARDLAAIRRLLKAAGGERALLAWVKLAGSTPAKHGGGRKQITVDDHLIADLGRAISKVANTIKPKRPNVTQFLDTFIAATARRQEWLGAGSNEAIRERLRRKLKAAGFIFERRAQK